MSTKTKHGIKTMDGLLSYLDERGFSVYEAIEFISDSLSKELRKKVIDSEYEAIEFIGDSLGKELQKVIDKVVEEYECI